MKRLDLIEAILIATLCAGLLILLAGCAGMPASQRVLVDRMIESSEVMDEHGFDDGVADPRLEELIHQQAETAEMLKEMLDVSDAPK